MERFIVSTYVEAGFKKTIQFPTDPWNLGIS